MPRFLKHRTSKKGLPPGALVYIADNKYTDLHIEVINYNKESFSERVVDHLEDIVPDAFSPESVTWVIIQGISDPKIVEQVGKIFGIHRLWLEDILNMDHRPKVEELNDLLFFIAKSITEFQPASNQMSFEQISLFLGENFVLTFHESQGDVLDIIKTRIKSNRGQIRGMGTDYLFYAVIDTVVDNYYEVLGKLGEDIEGLEKQIAGSELKDISKLIITLRNDLLYLDKAVRPVRDALNHIFRLDREDLKEETKKYFRDVYEHSVQIVETIDHYQQMLKTLMEFYQSQINLKLNEIMTFLTIFSTIFIPLTFIVGIYGMNFRYMPELNWKYGYFFSLFAMSAITALMIWYFKRKKWL